MEVVLNNKTIPEISIESQTIYTRLKELHPDDIATYEELSELIGRNVQHYRGHLTTAIRKCLSEHIHIESVRNVGVKRMTSEATVKAGGRPLKHVSKVMRTARKKMTTVDYDKLTKVLQVQHNTYLTLYGTHSYFSKAQQIKQVEEKVVEAQRQLPIGKTLDIFKK